MTVIPISLVLFVSSSGKTHYLEKELPYLMRKTIKLSLAGARRLYGEDIVVDGDHVISSTIGWPTGEWWNNLPHDECSRFKERALRTVIRHARNCFVLFGVFPGSMTHLENLCHEEGLPIEAVRIMHVPSKIIRRNVKYRIAEGSSHPKDIMEILRSRDKHDIPEYADITHYVNTVKEGVEPHIRTFLELKRNIVSIGIVHDIVRSIVLWNGERISVSYVNPKRSTIDFGSDAIEYDERLYPFDPSYAIFRNRVLRMLRTHLR